MRYLQTTANNNMPEPQPCSSLSSPCTSTSTHLDVTQSNGLLMSSPGHRRSNSATVIQTGTLVSLSDNQHVPTALCDQGCTLHQLHNHAASISPHASHELIPIKRSLEVEDSNHHEEIDLERGLLAYEYDSTTAPPTYSDVYEDEPGSSSTDSPRPSDSDPPPRNSPFFQPPGFLLEKKRAALAFILVFLAGLSNDLVLAFIHERVPETAPLPDIVFSHTPYIPFALSISEMCILLNTLFSFVIIALNKHRFTLLKRMLLVSSFLYGGRALCMLVTQVPVADTKYYCSPKMNETSFSLVFGRALSLVSGLGLSWSGKHVLCGDYIYSGHTLVLVHTYLVVKECTPKRWQLLHWVSCLMALTGVVCLLLSRGHYTVDVLIAYWVTSRVFSMYHTACSHAHLREYTHRNHLSRLCWFPLLRYFEDGVPCSVPLQFEWPLPWPKVQSVQSHKTNIY